ncbi:hypothetical protein BZG36_05566 [Bifiguratus adelaidae]|uniref:Alpha/beta hydrolase fold-3 domain-containing protein n=1 Tax=Bifiguratus adelaidae TaxID=1938954 RepID=A0A261XT82_9FUNG|nr:hypothetical protein BZG36_05566 [Bifiguratus adelaidae]
MAPNVEPSLDLLMSPIPSWSKSQTTTTTTTYTLETEKRCLTEGCCVARKRRTSFTTTTTTTTTSTTPTLPLILKLAKSLLLLRRNVASFSHDVILHALGHPKRPNWDIRLALFVSFFHQMILHRHLNDIPLARKVLDTQVPGLGGGDAVKVIPAQFTVKRRALPGLLARLDSQEKGDRTVTGEWVEDKNVWERENKDLGEEVEDRTCFQLGKGHRGRVREQHQRRRAKVVLYLHGGAYIVMSAKSHRDLTWRISRQTGMRVFAINYRLAPEIPFPGALQDAVSAFLHLIDPPTRGGLGYSPKNVIIMGDSAGGNLSLATMLYLRDHGFDLPGGACLLSPWVDLSFSTASHITNTHYDYLPPPMESHDPHHPTRMYLGAEQYPHLQRHPYVSPLFAPDLTRLPPMLVQSGSAECLRDEIREMAKRLKEAKTWCEHEEYPDMVHVFQAFGFLPEAKSALENLGVWCRRVLPVIQAFATMHTPLSLMPPKDDHTSIPTPQTPSTSPRPTQTLRMSRLSHTCKPIRHSRSDTDLTRRINETLRTRTLAEDVMWSSFARGPQAERIGRHLIRYGLGSITCAEEALLIFEACRQGILHKTKRRLNETEKKQLRAGAVYVFDEKESGIRRWTDGRQWSPSRITGNFLVYKEVAQKLPSCKGKRRRYMTTAIPQGAKVLESSKGTFIYASDGMIKKTISIKLNGHFQHLVYYDYPYRPRSPQRHGPCSFQELAQLVIQSDIVTKQSFRRPIRLQRLKVQQASVPLDQDWMSLHPSANYSEENESNDSSLESSIALDDPMEHTSIKNELVHVESGDQERWAVMAREGVSTPHVSYDSDMQEESMPSTTFSLDRDQGFEQGAPYMVWTPWLYQSMTMDRESCVFGHPFLTPKYTVYPMAGVADPFQWMEGDQCHGLDIRDPFLGQDEETA